MKITGLYHSRDLDGYTSGAIIKRKYPEATMIGWDYGQPIPDIKDQDLVIMADISFPMNDMHLLSKNNGGNFVWIDHHISAINDYKAYLEEYSAIIDGETFLKDSNLKTTKSACELCWEFFFPDENMPLAINYLGVYDTWREKGTERWNCEIEPFQYGMRILCDSPKTFPDEIFNNDLEFNKSVISKGITILDFMDKYNQEQCKHAFESEVFGKKAICLNTTGLGSAVFSSKWNPDVYDIMIVFKFDGKKWKFSIYTEKDDIDVSKFAKSKGGGGHKGASGFEISDITEIFPQISDDMDLKQIYW